MIGTIKYSSKIKYGKNKRGLPYYLFYNNTKDKVIVASKLKTRVDHYAKIEIINNNCNPKKGAIIQILGPVNEYKSTVDYILHKHDILPRKPLKINCEEYDSVIDLTNKNVISIDPEETRDVDDAFHFEFHDDILELGIHITDTSGIRLDDEQFIKLANYSQTVYTSLKNYNIFDEKISHDQLSLIQNEPRNVISLIIIFNNEIDYKFQKSLVINKNKLSYDKADKIIKRDKKWKKMTQILEHYLKTKINDSHILIEKLMILYNNKMAKFLKEKKIEYPMRVHKGLNNDTIKNYDDLSGLNDIDQELFKKICFHSAEYVSSSTNNQSNHYGLQLKDYVHSTSPLRRFNDYVIQQIFTYQTNYNINKLCQIMNNTNSKIKQVYYDLVKLDLVKELESTNERLFDGIITKILENGIIVYIKQLDIIHPIYFTSKLSDILEISSTNINITITHKRNRCNVKLQLLQNITLKAIITPYEPKMNHKIRFHLEKPSIIGLLDL